MTRSNRRHTFRRQFKFKIEYFSLAHLIKQAPRTHEAVGRLDSVSRMWMIVCVYVYTYNLPRTNFDNLPLGLHLSAQLSRRQSLAINVRSNSLIKYAANPSTRSSFGSQFYPLPHPLLVFCLQTRGEITISSRCTLYFARLLTGGFRK